MTTTTKERYAELDSWGICHMCKKRPKAPGKQYCLDCLYKEREYRRQLYQKRKAEGLCVKCGKPATNGYLCYKHYVKKKQEDAKQVEKNRLENYNKGISREYRIENRLCYYCGKSLEDGNTTKVCNACRERQRELAKRISKNSPWHRDNKMIFKEKK